MTCFRPGLPLRVYLGNQSSFGLLNRGDLIQGISYKDDEKAVKINRGTGRQRLITEIHISMRLLLSPCSKKTIMAFQRKLGP